MADSTNYLASHEFIASLAGSFGIISPTSSSLPSLLPQYIYSVYIISYLGRYFLHFLWLCPVLARSLPRLQLHLADLHVHPAFNYLLRTTALHRHQSVLSSCSSDILINQDARRFPLLLRENCRNSDIDSCHWHAGEFYPSLYPARLRSLTQPVSGMVRSRL